MTKSVKVFLSDGTSYSTSVNGACSNEEITRYFVGQLFNIGTVKDEMKKCEKVEISS
jgi:hypothetical protein